MATQETKPNGSEGLVPQAAGTVARQEFGATQLEISGETAGTALAAQARAMVEARFIVAMRRPRDWDDVRTKLLKACERPGFAGSATEKIWGAAWYRKPVGEGVEGFSVRFAEEAARAMGNIDVQVVPVYDDPLRRIVTVTVMDLESNIAFPTSISFEKTVERKFLKKGEVAIRVRVNSEGRPVYVLPATDDDVATKQANLASKALRNGLLRILPGDIASACRSRILEIRNGAAAKDPDKARRELADGFAALNILPSALKEYLGHELSLSTPAELTDLRELWMELKEGKTTWPEVMEEVRAERGQEPGEAPPKPKPGLDGVTETLKAKAAAREPGSDDGWPAPGCEHLSVPPSRVAALPAGKSIVCPDCGEELKNAVGMRPAVEPAADPRAAVAAVAKTAEKGRQGTQKRLDE